MRETSGSLSGTSLCFDRVYRKKPEEDPEETLRARIYEEIARGGVFGRLWKRSVKKRREGGSVRGTSFCRLSRKTQAVM